MGVYSTVFRIAAGAFLAALLMGGCGADDSSSTSPAAEADARLARVIDASAARYQREFRSVGVEGAIEDINARNDPPKTTETEDPAAPTTPNEKARKPKTTRPERTRPSAPPAAPARPTELLSAADRESFAQLAAQLGGSSGIAVTPAGRGGSPETAGELSGGVAWSTMKTGVAAATFARGTPDGSTQALLRRAITASDNAAAEQLWSQLGAPPQAGALVQAQLRAAGDNSTSVQTERVRAGFTAFGQSQWSLANQARFTAGMTCTSAGRSVLQLMGEVVSDQRWGLGSAGVSARFKGGWGPGTSGGYLVRQMGILTVRGHPIAITIATLPSDGSFGSGTSNLTQIAKWFVAHVEPKAAPIHPRC